MKTDKEKLSEYVEEIFKRYTSSGLHICDIATGGGKSYTISKLTCEYYPKEFNRIVILCVQKKLVEGINREINEFVHSQNSIISRNDILVIDNNEEVIKKAIDNGAFEKFIDQIESCIEVLSSGNVKELTFGCKRIKKTYEGIKNLFQVQGNKNELLSNQISDAELKLRNDVRNFFEIYKKYLKQTNKENDISINQLIRTFPALSEVYPQVDYKRKKVLLMTVHKAMYGIDPIISEKVYINNIADNNHRTLIIFDESDQAAIVMRNTIIEQAIDNYSGSNRFAKGYNGYLQYKQLIDNPEHISDEYHGELLHECLNKANNTIKSSWNKIFGNTIPYKNIFLGDIEDLENYRRGVFFSGSGLRLNVSNSKDNKQSYICYSKGEKHFKLFHAEKDTELKESFDYVIPMDNFLSLVIENTKVIKGQLCQVVKTALQTSIEKFKQTAKGLGKNKLPDNHYLGYPTIEREIYTLISRFETNSDYQFAQQLLEFMTNRKSINKKSEKLDLPDYSVYSQGVQLYQEEIDERDNQHRVRLSCREISTTPEKILIDLILSGNISVVLCSATASSTSVISNFDIEYLKERIGDKIHVLSMEVKSKFDELVSNTYPKGHKVEIIPLEHYEYEDKRDEKAVLPDKYRILFSEEARKDGLDNTWFKCTKRYLMHNKKEGESISFQLYRLFQFIEAYAWFIKHEDVHSMIFFQNRIGDPIQTNVLSCLIDGSYKQQKSVFEDELPEDWTNEHIRISKNWEEVEGTILKELSDNKDAKIMLISAYASFKAGANMQYEIPDGLEYIQGDNWNKEGEKLQKDWDAMYIQCPRTYLMMNTDENEINFEKSLYNVMLSLMMLYERGCLSKNEIASWLCKALSNNFWFGDKNNPGIARDKAEWAQTIIEQAVGRLCRTRNKPQTTYILYDKDINYFFDKVNLKKSLTKEFRSLVSYILADEQKTVDSNINNDEIIRCNNANYAKRQLDRMRNIALRYTPKLGKKDYFDDEDEDINTVPYNVMINQKMNQSYKQTIIRKPVVSDFNELEDSDKNLSFIHKCYGDWKRNNENEIFFHYDPKHNNYFCPATKGKPGQFPVSPQSVRLDVLMKNEVIRLYFEQNGFATDWETKGMILHPDILMTDYAGEIGEEAFKAIVLHYTNCKENEIKHLEGRDYELADFVICNPDGSYKIAFDVKNMNPDIDHDDKPGELPTKEKRAIKRKRLGCQLITVSMLQLSKEPMGDITEIHGIIDDNGKIIESAIETLKLLID